MSRTVSLMTLMAQRAFGGATQVTDTIRGEVKVVSMDRNSWAGVVSPMNGSAGKSCGMRASKTARFARPEPLRSPRKLSAVDGGLVAAVSHGRAH